MAGLSKSDKFYIQGHADMSVEDIAKDLGKTKSSHKSIQKFRDELKEAAKAKVVPKPPNHFGYGPQNSVVMTEGQSKLGDDIMAEISAGGKDYLKSKEASIFVMDPAKPVY